MDSRRMDRLLDVPPPGLTHGEWRKVSHPLGFLLARDLNDLKAWLIHVALDKTLNRSPTRRRRGCI